MKIEQAEKDSRKQKQENKRSLLLRQTFTLIITYCIGVPVMYPMHDDIHNTCIVVYSYVHLPACLPVCQQGRIKTSSSRRRRRRRRREGESRFLFHMDMEGTLLRVQHRKLLTIETLLKLHQLSSCLLHHLN